MLETAGTADANQYDLESSATTAANALDNGSLSREAAETVFNREHKAAISAGAEVDFIKTVDELEKDGGGLDLAARYDLNHTPLEFQILPHDWHTDAKSMATLMDAGKAPEAIKLQYDMDGKIKTAFPGITNMLEVRRQKQSWMKTIDFYEQSNKGYDVNIFDMPGGSEARFDFLRNPFIDK